MEYASLQLGVLLFANERAFKEANVRGFVVGATATNLAKYVCVWGICLVNQPPPMHSKCVAQT